MAKNRQKQTRPGMRRLMAGLTAGLTAIVTGLGACPAAAAGPKPVPFMWGFASSSYQYEEPEADTGSARYFETDWDLFFAARGQRAPRRNGIFGWRDFDKEVAALRQVGATHYRFSIEWARVEPQPGIYNQAAIAEYARRARLLRASGITPVVCLWHFTFPDWASDLNRPERHGWLNPRLRERWGPYIETMARAFGADVALYAPQNEVNNVARGGYLLGAFPPGKVMHIKDYQRSMDLAAAYFRQASRSLKRINPAARVLSVQNVFAWDEAAAQALSGYVHDFTYRYLDRIASSLDYLGFNYYTREPLGPAGLASMYLKAGQSGYSDLGWQIDAGGMYQVAKKLYARYKLPLVVTENGIADHRDCKRASYLAGHLASLKRLERDGVPVLGYFHWSLADNYEWGAGFEARFGMFSLGQDQQTLVAKPSANYYRSLIAQGWDAIQPNMPLPEETCQAGA